jgi:hypothetical protein
MSSDEPETLPMPGFSDSVAVTSPQSNGVEISWLRGGASRCLSCAQDRRKADALHCSNTIARLRRTVRPLDFFRMLHAALEISHKAIEAKLCHFAGRL